VITKKGKGYPVAEQNPVVWHGATPFDKISGEMAQKKGGLPAYTNVFGKGLVELGAVFPKLAVITAAMPSGTGTGLFADAYPGRFFDVGIAEGHAVTFAAGLSVEGIRPVAAIYSTFLQRAYDYPSFLPWIALGWSAMTARHTWGCTTSPTCWPCRT
jgi:1-deoxy-D-xylulose-5-phosphate synthase